MSKPSPRSNAVAPITPSRVRPRTFQTALLAGVSALTLLVGGGAQAGQLSQALATAAGSSATANASASAITSAQQATAMTQQSQQNLAQAASALKAALALQAAARTLALQTPGAIPNGLAAGGLQVAPGVGSDPTLWQNADLPTQSSANGQTTVTIQQTAQKSILTWQSFNVSASTTVHFDQTAGTQSDGSNNWISLNRIQDPSGVPSQILGQIKAEGSVYLINRNGIVFGGSSQVDVHTLVASSLGFLGESVTAAMVPGTAAYDNAVAASNTLFLNQTNGGIAAPEASGASGASGAGNLVLGIGSPLTGAAAAGFVPSGTIDIAAGAVITTHANGSASDGGFVLIAAPNVSNAGAISTPDGQAILAAGIGVSLLQSATSTQFLVPELTGQISLNGQDVTPAGSLINTGLVQATTGNVTLLGGNMTVGGVVAVTTSVSVPGSISISTVDEAEVTDVSPNVPADRRAGALIVSGTIANLPEENGQTVPSDGSTFTAGSVSLTGGSVWLQNGSLIEAPAATVGVTALSGSASPAGDTAVQGRVYIDAGATIDVAGLANVALPMSDILFTIPLIGANELADSPLQRDGFLLGLKNVVLDSTLSGTTADGLAWVGSPILNASGYADLIPRSIDQLMINGGSITLSGGQVLTAAGSSLSLDGGYIHYLGGMVDTTKLIDADGHVVSIGNADPADTYVGVAGLVTVAHSHWGVTETYENPLLSGGYYQPDYIAGGNAGTLSVFGEQATVLDGAMSAQAFPGLKQVEAGLAPSGTSSGGNYLPEGGSFVLGTAFATYGSGNAPSGVLGSIIIQNEAPQLSDLSLGFDASTPLNTTALNALGTNDPNNILAWTTVPAVPIETGGFANVSVTIDKAQVGRIVVAAGTDLVVQPGGSITLKTPGTVSVLGELSAPAGTISIAYDGNGFATTPNNIIVGPDATISVAGVWVNDDSRDANTAGDTTFINGGSITLSTGDAGDAGNAGGTDTTGSIILQPGSLLDVSGGGVLLASGLLSKNGIPEGKGGSLSLLTYSATTFQFGDTGSGGPALPKTQPTTAGIVMDGTIESWGFAGGGTLTLQALGFQIGGAASQAPSWDLYLPADFFAGQGFGKYQLNAMYDATVAPGATVAVTQRNLIPNVAALAQAATGADLNAGGLTTLGTLDPYDRQATSLVITAGGDLDWSTTTGASPLYTGVANAVTIGLGASILADAGAAIGLGAPGQVTVLGSIIAPGGSITLSADDGSGYGYSQAGQAQATVTSPGKSVWLGADAVLDVSGIALTDPFAAPVRLGDAVTTPVTGKVLPGGSVVLSDDSGYVVVQAGAVINVSGASAVLDELQSSGQVRLGEPDDAYAPALVWSNAGSITLAAFGGLYFDGTLMAQAGAPQGQGGTLTLQPEVNNTTTVFNSNGSTTKYSGGSVTVTQPNGTSFTMPGATAVILQQSGGFVPAGLAAGQTFPGTPTGTLYFAVDRLQGSGIATLVIGGATYASGAEQPLVPVAFAGNVNLSLANAVIINATDIVALTAGATSLLTLQAGTGAIGAPTVSITAPYVEINGGTTSGAALWSPTAALAGGTLDVDASFIDIENQVGLANFAQANFTSSGDIRLSSTNTNGTSTLLPGVLYTPGNLTLQAADLYPASGETFILDAVGPNPTTITFLSNGPSQVPLSAGASLLVDATNIVQSGTIRVPSGSIVLGVGNATDSDTETAFDKMPLINTQSVAFTAGSVTSVSLDGVIVPYGTTTDGEDWQYNAVAANTSIVDLTAPPAKVITVNGSNVSLESGATIDLSGGGDLQAVEWVPGTGGSRNVLAQYNITYPESGAAVATPLYADARNVYAIVPSYEAPVAAYDPVYAQTTQPATTASGTVSSQTLSSGVGQAAIGGQIGQAVYLSGVSGLPAGTYTLLPAQYATLPGAYRVVVDTSVSTAVPGQSVTLPDGTQMVSGYFVDGLNGARSSTISVFEVQSAAVWRQYSQYTLTSANSFFATLAANAGTVTPALPMDAGRLVLAATGSLILDTTLKAAAATGGAPAEVDIASQDIQIVGSGETALAGYLQVSSDSLDALGAGSLLIGGTRTATTSGVTIDALANSIVVSNDANDPLTGPEIILVARTDPTGADPHAANGLTVAAGSVIAVNGAFPASTDVPITLGGTATSGDGALLMLTNGAVVSITRDDLPATRLGSLTVGAGAVLNGGQSLLLDSSGNLRFDPAASFSGRSIAVDAAAITLTDETGAAAAALPGFVIGPNGLAQLAAAQEVTLSSYGAIDFVGNVVLDFGNAVDFSAGTFASDGNAVAITATQVTFSNDLGASVGTAAAGTGSLSVTAREIDLGAGDKALSGFGSVSLTASGGIVGQGSGTLDLGAAATILAAPVYLADTSSATTLTTTGPLTLNGGAGSPLALTPVGGAIGFIGGSLVDSGATIEASAGDVSLEATSGNLTIASGALVGAAGMAKVFYDVTEYAPAGSISLTADLGSVVVQSGATLDVSGAAGGGAAGSLTFSAPQQTVQLNGTLKGGAAAGYAGGSFSLNTGGAVDLDTLAVELASSGINTAITVDTKSGNLVLSAGNTLTATSVSLTADGGSAGDPNNGTVTILGTINASGTAGGEIGLYGKSGVDIEGSLIATGSSASQLGGTVDIGTGGTFNVATGTYNGNYGYEAISAANSGTITLGANALIDVTGGSSGGLSGGTVNLRAPLLANGSVNVTVPSVFAANKGIVGSRSTTLEAYAVWSTTDNTTGALHFDGIIDPAGWYNDAVSGAGQPGMVAGTWTDQKGNPLPNPTAAQLATYLTNDYFTPTAANTDHQAFYGYKSDGTTPGTVMGFVENGLGATPSFAAQFAQVQNFQVAPGVELDNPSTAINGGNISVLTNWNLGGGAPNNYGTINPAYRYQSTIAPILTLRAVNSFNAQASITDGFYQSQVASILGGQAAGGGGAAATYAQAESTYNSLMATDGTPVTVTYYTGSSAPLASLDPNSTLSAPLTGQASLYYTDYLAYASAWGTNYADWETSTILNGHIIPISTTPSASAPNLANYGSYSAYLSAYNTFILTLARTNAGTFGTPPAITLSTNPSDYAAYIAEYTAYLSKMVALNSETIASPKRSNFFYDPSAPLTIPSVGNSIGVLPGNAASNMPTTNNPLPIAFATLLGGESTSYRIVAGADLSSADPLAVETSGGNVTLNGHTAYVDSSGDTLFDPTTIRTGTGSIDIAAANNVSLADTTAPGVIYTAGAPAAGTPQGSTESILAGDLLVTPAVNPDGAGNVSIVAGNDITGIETLNSQFWWEWMQTGNTYAGTQITQTSINFGAFDQGVMSVGGNVTIAAGGNITNLAVSLPTTWYLSNNNTTVNIVGGGNLTVTAGGNILSGDYFVANGTGTLTAGGQVGSSGLTQVLNTGEVSTILASQNGVFNVTARQGVDIGAMVDPSYLQSSKLIDTYGLHADAQSYSANSALNVVSTTGTVAFNTLGDNSLIGAGQPGGSGDNDDSEVLPATVNLIALTGGITVAAEAAGELYPSATGQLSLIADQSINLSGATNADLNASGFFGLIDAAASALPSPLNPMPTTAVGVTNEFDGKLTSDAPIDHSQIALHANDTQPVRIYSLTGSITDGTLGSNGEYSDLLQISVDKPAEIQAGKDIRNLAFLGQNLRDDDVTSIIAGRDIYDTTNFSFTSDFIAPAFVLGGPGTFLIEAGRNIGPLINQQEIYDLEGSAYNTSTITGIDTIGNADDPYLPHQSASVQVLFGVGPGIDTQAFIADYIAPTASIPGIDTTPALIAFMEQYDDEQGIDTGLVADKPSVTLTAAQAWAQFQALPVSVQLLFADQELFQVLQTVGQDYNNSASPYYRQYARGYQAINTLFPASYGYTANGLDGGTNGANKLVDTGDLDIRSTTIQTQQGGNVTILGPGGQALVGSTDAPPVITNANGKVVVGPGSEGILTLEQGNVDIFTDQSLLLAQSRVFTEQGGDMVIWSSNGDINAGKGAKTISDVPPPDYVSDDDHYNTLDARGEVTGAGIATLQTIPGAEPGSVYLIAPRGTVDAGAAGIRVSGDLFVAALQVLNANNIQVQGASIGVPQAASVNVGALTTASNTVGAAANAATNAVKQPSRSGNADLPSIITIEVIGYGGGDSNGHVYTIKSDQDYDPNGSVQFEGLGALSDDQKKRVFENDNKKLRK